MRNVLVILFMLWSFNLTAQKQAIVHLTTDNYPTETYWQVLTGTSGIPGDTIANVPPGYYTQANTTYTDTLYINDSITNVSFLLRDVYGDGMTSGSYYFSVCGDTIVNYPIPNPNIGYGLYHNRTIPQCMPQPPPGGCTGVTVRVSINLDQFPSETSWNIKDSLGTIYGQGGPYTGLPAYQPQNYNVCLPIDREATFYLYDTFGDGLGGAQWGGQDGSWLIRQCGDTIIYGVGDFGDTLTHSWYPDSCIPPPPVLGCMDENYVEYNALATQDDSSCATLKVYGCVDSTMFNYNTLANWMDYIDSCTHTVTLYDLAGNGWVGSRLEVYQEDTSVYVLNSGFDTSFTLNLKAPYTVSAKFFVVAQASQTAIECGFSIVSASGDTAIYQPGGFASPIQPFHLYSGTTYCGNECIPIVVGCLDSTAYNYDVFANTADTCYYAPGCTSPAYLEYYTQGYVADIDNGSCNILAAFGCTDSTMFNYDSTANVDNGGCIPVIEGCMNSLAFNYNALANTPDSCIPVIYGCTSPIAFNYDSLANTDDGSCIGVVYGCTDSTMWNYSPSANVDNGGCIPYMYGCTDPTMFNYDANANTDNGSCLPYVYGCTDASMFNYDPTANTDNGSCIPFIYGCTNPAAINYCDSCNTNDFSCVLPIYGCMDSTMFNYNPLANVDNGSCVPFIYGCNDPSSYNFNPLANTSDNSCCYIAGCMNSTALNYDPMACYDDGSCITIIIGCTDISAYNYNPQVNVSDSTVCLYDAGCVGGPGVPYWLNDPCYAWVIDVDDYCCNVAWDADCQSMYNYCEAGWTGPTGIQDVSGGIIIYPNPTTGIIRASQEIDIIVYDFMGKIVYKGKGVKYVDLSNEANGIYTISVNNRHTYKLIKE